LSGHPGHPLDPPLAARLKNNSVFSLVNSADRVALPASAAAVRRAATPLLLDAPATVAVDRYLLLARRSAANPSRRCCGRMMGQKDGRRDGHTEGHRTVT